MRFFITLPPFTGSPRCQAGEYLREMMANIRWTPPMNYPFEKRLLPPPSIPTNFSSTNVKNSNTGN